MRTAVPATSYITLLPFTFIVWWFSDNVKLTYRILSYIFILVIHLLGYKSLFKTFFQPWKNEYREGLVGFSKLMGAFMKSLMIFTESIILLILLAFEFVIFMVWIFLPIISLWGIYAGLFT